MDKQKIDKAKDVIAILQEQFIDTKFILVTSEDDYRKAIEDSKAKDEDLKLTEDFWSQDFEGL